MSRWLASLTTALEITMENFNNSDLRQDLISTVSDLYKDVHGVRPRFARWEEYTIEELQRWADDLEGEIMELQSINQYEDYLRFVEREETLAEVPNPEDAWDRYAEYEID